MSVEQVAAIVAQHPTIDLKTADFHDRELLRSLQLDGTGSRETLAAVKSYQRLLRIAGSPDHAAELAAAGFDSARSIAQHSGPTRRRSPTRSTRRACSSGSRCSSRAPASRATNDQPLLPPPPRDPEQRIRDPIHRDARNQSHGPLPER